MKKNQCHAYIGDVTQFSTNRHVYARVITAARYFRQIRLFSVFDKSGSFWKKIPYHFSLHDGRGDCILGHGKEERKQDRGRNNCEGQGV